MQASRSIIALFAGAGILATTVTADPGPDPGPSPDPVQYQLADDTLFETGCFPPCECPVLIRQPVKGSFDLVDKGFDGQFRHFEVRDVDWVMNSSGPGASVQVRGSGIYRLGGEFAQQHQMVLDLSVDGEASQRFDSGVVSGGSEFPRIQILIAVNGFFCRDSVFAVHALPRSTGVTPPGARPLVLQARPNPFASSTDLSFALSAVSRVDLRIFDLTGREVRALQEGQTSGVGLQRVSWDGRTADGQAAPAGIYFAKLVTQGQERRTALVKIE